MGKKARLRRLMKKRELGDAPAVIVCVGKKCAPRDASCALVDKLRTYAKQEHPGVRIETVKCLHVCKAGPIAATYPRIRIRKHVGARRGRKLVDKVDR